MGRKAVPTALKVIKGTDQPCRTNKSEPKAGTDKLRCPASLPPEAKKFWKKFVPELKAIGVVKNTDLPAIEALCLKYAEWQEYQEKVRTMGALVKSPKNGYPIASPYFGMANKAFDQFSKMLTEFGMTPSSRTKVVVTDPDSGKDDWDDL